MAGVLLILGGLALFMYGIRMLSAGMEKLAGDQIQKWLDRVTSSKLKSAAFGAASTAILQSSGLLMVTMIGLINANLMTVEQSIGVMLGQEIGTTITAQIVAFDIGFFRLILVILGFILLEFFPHKDWKKYGEILMGLGIVFVGMSYMAQALDLLVEIPWIKQALVQMSLHPLVGVLAGLLMTSVTQSSTAVTSMAVAMGISQVITLQGAIGIILGANIGSCITGLIASLPLSRTARSRALATRSLISWPPASSSLAFISFTCCRAKSICRSNVSWRRKLLSEAQASTFTPSCITRSRVISPSWLSTPKTCTNNSSKAGPC